MQLTFDQFKNIFYDKVKDLTVFDCSDFNTLKVVLDGLKVNYISKGIQDDTILKTTWELKVQFFLQRKKYAAQYEEAQKHLVRIRQGKAKYLLFDNGRSAYGDKGELVSFYFDKIKKELGEEKCYVIYQKPVKFHDGLTFQKLEAIKYAPLSKEDHQLRISLRETYRKIELLKCFSHEELTNIRTAFGLFFSQYRIWIRLLSGMGFKVCFFDQHYHREGMLLALKRLQIKSAELQHGLIAKEDIFYVFPDRILGIAHAALFPDKIYTYSQFWSDILATGYEFRKNQIDVIGQYQYINTNINSLQEKAFYEFVGDRPFILITTQTYLHSYFLDYITWLSADLHSRNARHLVVVKLHPSEKEQDYDALLKLDNVKVFDCNTEFLLSKCSHHVSIYSTTLYDASKYNCENYSLNVDRCRDYIASMIASGVSSLLELAENPLDKQQNGKNMVCFYEDFNLHKGKLSNL